MNEFEAELAEEMAEENVVSNCMACMGTGIIMVANEFVERATECECLKKYHENF
jgi:hypothetical protein